ncbi:hypothetical protein ASPZODRAFT_146129 [Penicilliopsis zonata CBS 506.65]|uniref:Mediator of RNA polymerase II transcription subunit 12 n=1 Tax=Penicilliopsis zonata CBS 506.65 TaxID=1073090 RepID=A0A1L9S8C8_9EURO|nr:hypothetical protein ASPZODRAFT_146129 [Penicilliopsis zonata CBS 506.65]OJJ43413.1 hypothetical protein ASPZODRAFT_146129 [Penicilliopsis zonata CBS 506.65]
MIPHSSAGVQPWDHPLRALNNGAARVENVQGPPQVADLPTARLPAQSQLRQPVIVDLTASGPDSQEPPSKRQKLDTPAAPTSGDPHITPSTADQKNGTLAAAGSRPTALSWRGRPAWSFQALISETYGAGSQGEGQQQEAKSASSPPPFPVLPANLSLPEAGGGDPVGSREKSPDQEVKTTPYRIKVPLVAPTLKGEKVADFSPWNGNHPEDILNEQTAKQGYYDRTQVSQNESNTARPSLYAQLKHRSGLQMLSSVFAAALEKRQNHNMVTAPSTFKPPPRVTLTDNKREAWLRDLANPAVPLRRLSRTIPHGIRGKLLLDQCLSKWVPVGRAVWLAKCVGANEIRAFKRKGTSGALAVGLEVKWVRDWTTSVQQFIEGVLSTCGKADWKVKMTYAVSLTSRLFFEHLLDHDHYLEWMLSSLEAASTNALPLWLLMLGIYWDNIMQYRKRGRRLTEILLQKLQQVTKSKQAGPLQPLVDRLSHCIKRIVHEQTSSAVLPNCWDTFKETVASCLDLNENVNRSIFQSLSERNARVQYPKDPRCKTQYPSQQRIIRYLDSVRSTHDIQSISSACLDTVEDKALLVFKLLEWSATPFRSGLCRVYTAVRLLRKWKISGVDVDSHILAFLRGAAGNVRIDANNIYHVISELVRSQTFSVGKYLQWLMAKGVAKDSDETQSTGKLSDAQLLAQLPVSRLLEHVRNLRNTLLDRVGISALEESRMIEHVRACVAQRLPHMFDSGLADLKHTELVPVSLTWAVKSEIGQWLRRAVAQHYQSGGARAPGSRRSFSGSLEVSALTPEEFYTVRDLFETFGDLSMLADVLHHASNSGDPIVLASAADTLNYHYDSFTVIGATTDLFRRLVEASARLKNMGITSLDLVFSLIELGLRLPTESSTVTLLRQELARMENRSALAVPSPLSDNVPDALHGSDPSFYDKLEQLLLSGTGLDEFTLNTIFQSLVKKLECGDLGGELSPNEICRRLAHLRSFNPKHFDILLVRWVCTILKSPTRPSLRHILVPLIGVGCVTIQAFISLARKMSKAETATASLPDLAGLQLDILELLVSPTQETPKFYDLVDYRFRLARQEFLSKHVQEILVIAHESAVAITQQNAGLDTDTRRAKFKSYMTILLRHVLISDPECVGQDHMQRLLDQHPEATVALQHALDLLLGLDASGSDCKSSLAEANQLIDMTNDFSLPFCQLKLQSLFNTNTEDGVRAGIVDMMFKAAVADSRAKSSHWVDLVALMNRDAIQQIRERAERGFFSITLPSDHTNEDSSGPIENITSFEAARVYLKVIEDLAYSIPDHGVSHVAPMLVEKLDQLLHRLITTQTNFRSIVGSRDAMLTEQIIQSRSNVERAFAFWFSALLRMVVIHRQAFHTNAVSEQSRLLVSIISIAFARFPDKVLRMFPSAGYFPRHGQDENNRPCPGVLLQTHALDVAASLIDTFPDEARHQCARMLKEKCPPFIHFQKDPRFLYLLGPAMDGSLINLSQLASLPSPAASGSTPTPGPSGNTLMAPAPSHQQPCMSSSSSSVLSENSVFMANRLHLQQRGRVVGPYPIRPWELLGDAAPILGANDTAIGLGLFEARRVRV